MSYQDLNTELKLAKYSGMNNAQLITELNNPVLDDVQEVPVKTVVNYFLYSGVWMKLKQKAASSPTTTAESNATIAANIIIDTASIRKDGDINMSKPEVVGMLNYLEADNVITTDEKNTIIAMGNIKVSRANQLGFGTITGRDIRKAKSYG